MSEPSCPTCAVECRRTGHSGAFVDLVTESIPGSETLWASLDGTYPEADLVRCAGCGQAWGVLHSYPDRPPYFVVLEALSEQDVEAILAGTTEAFIELALRGGTYVRFDGLLAGMALNADESTQLAMRSHEQLPERVAEAWDRRVRWGSRLVRVD
jgi:hypothetical protein